MTGIVLLLVVAGLTLGPLGHLSLLYPATPNLFVVFLWAVTWFRRPEEALRLAIVGGLLLDLSGFSYFGIWTISASAIVLTTVALRSRFLDAARLLHSLIALVVASLIPTFLFAIVTISVPYREIILSVLGNVALGLVVYYLFAMRFKLFQRWAGRRIG